MTRRRVASDARGDDVVGVGTFPEMTRETVGEKPIPAPNALRGYVAPPSANKVVGYRAWFGAILLLEYALTLKAIASFKAYETRSVAEVKLLTHRWVFIALCVVIDAVALWFLNAFPGVPEAGLARQSEKDAARGEHRRRATSRVGAASNAARLSRRLRVPQYVPLLVRHALKMFNRVPTIASTLMGSPWRLYHGFTQGQTLMILLNPTFNNVAFGGGNGAFLTAQSVINAAFVLTVSYLNRDAYALYPDTMRRDFHRDCGDTSTFYTVVLPIVVAAPFAFDFLLRQDAAVSGLEFMWRVYFGEQAQLGKEAGLESTPWMMRRVAGRLRGTAKCVIPLALSLIIGAVAHACLTPFDDAFDAYDAPSILRMALSMVCLVASVMVPGRLADAFSASPEGLREFNENVRNGAEKAAFKVAASYAATSALACALVTGGNILGIPTHAVTSIAVYAWLPAWGIVAAYACAVTPSPGVPRAARAAAAAVAVAVAGLVVIDPRAIEYLVTFAREQTTNCAVALSLAYLCALHAANAWSIHARILFEDAPGGIDEEMQEMLWVEATKSGLPRARKGHWQPEDFELDPSRFEMRPRDRHLSLDDARYAFVPLSRNVRDGTGRENAFAALREPFASARDVSVCRAQGCGEPVKSSDVLAEGLNLCAEHMVAEEPFQCELRGGASLFCVLCRRVHAMPRCGDREDDDILYTHSIHASINEIRACAAAGNSAAQRVTEPSLHTRDVSMRAWYKTEEGPVEATARMRDVVGDFASLQPGNARVLHAEVTARPGCTLLTVDIAALLEEDDAASQYDARNDVVDGDTGSGDARDEAISRALADAGVRNGLHGVLDFEITGGGGGVPSEARRRTLRRFAFDGRNRTSTTMELEIAPHFAHFARFQRFGLFGAESATRGDDDANGGLDPRADDRLPVLRSDRYDALRLPTAPEGFAYVLRCGGTYLPLLAPWDANRDATSTLHAPPSGAEGLGFIELIALQDLEEHDVDLEDGPVNVSGRVDISPLLSSEVFITPNARLAAELGDPVTGAKPEHAPMLFNIGAALTGRASGAVGGASGLDGHFRFAGDSDDSERVRDEAVFHAACGAASMGWSVAVGRITANVEVRRNGLPWSCSRDEYAAWMSESPDTATDEYSSDGGSRGGSRLTDVTGTLGTLAGAATLMRAACSSGNALTSRVVIAWVIRNFGAVVAGDLLSVGDGGSVGNDWTPLHAAAHAIARRARESAALESQLARALAIIEMVTRGASRSVCADVIATADEVIGMLAISGDPLYWVRNSATRAAAPSEVLRDAGDTGSSTFSEQIAAWRTGRERVALDERILQTLSVATRNAVGFLRSVTPQEKPLPVHEHFTAAASFSAFAYDGSKASTMTVALLSPSSSVSWDALRARALDDTRGDVSSEEAMDWLRAGAPSDGFPVPSAEEIMARDVGVEASVLCTAIDAAMMTLVISPTMRSLGYGALSPCRIGFVLLQWLAPAACFFARAATSKSKRLGSERRATNARVRLVGAGAQTLATYFTKRLLIGQNHVSEVWPVVVPCAARCALMFAQAVVVPCGSLAKETRAVLLGALACLALVEDPGVTLFPRVPGVFVSVRATLIATLVARCARWCVPRVARTRVDKLAATRMAAFDGEAKKTK